MDMVKNSPAVQLADNLMAQVGGEHWSYTGELRVTLMGMVSAQLCSSFQTTSRRR